MHPIYQLASLALPHVIWIANPAAATVTNKDSQGLLQAVFGKMTNHGACDFLFLGSDGVPRSFNNATMVVTDAQPLSPREISVYLGGMTVQERHKPYGSQSPLLADNSRADGHKVPVAEWMSPPAAIVTEAALRHEKAKGAVTQSKNPTAVLGYKYATGYKGPS
ncbi:hypothetical protein H634G_07486 [Metarhizium anisopliae BRIP 53293]|uniref:Uncharacterized protein n=1 Tax=Metarhizium anisopliae BRIP 53293 TaxID=1291518 RepID=A0A0D9NT51_METAN|nr:hypothetical protein H634G_07486 [Metarhizium anisopliae BRIP 53293]KJK96079.1 hypothetical protein H633G_00019 [Metarhizium anisopliae BRIP 53284]